MLFQSTLANKLIYVFSMPYADHKDCLKIGEATCNKDITKLMPNCKELNDAAKKRINQYTQTAGVHYDLLYTESTIFIRNGYICSFNDKEVHDVLRRSGIPRKTFDKQNDANEWFITDLDTVKRAIAAVKECRKAITPITTELPTKITFRPEQQQAIDMAVSRFKSKNTKNHKVLWNAKMRFGKTLSALQVVKLMGFGKTLILTHRPVVNEGWFDDFAKIFPNDPTHRYGSRIKGDTLPSLLNAHNNQNIRIVYFASIQDLRGSETVGGKFDKNNELFSTTWDLLIVDEAHEGTQTQLGKAVINELSKPNTRLLALSGTPFNLIENNEFPQDNIFTWDYVMEQRAKTNWDQIHPGDPNPYAPLPTMNIYTYNLGKLLKRFQDEDIAFNFTEFFRTNPDGHFIHHNDITAFLNLLTADDPNSLYPFANNNYRDIFRHTLWTLPGVKEARALSHMLKQHPIFQSFDIVNVAGNGDQEDEALDALEKVNRAITQHPEHTRTITLTCGRLTTGVTIPAWTAVLILSGTYSTSAMSYMQTIFRVQTPATIAGKQKNECYVFDFAPDRTLRVIAEAVNISAKAGNTTNSDRKQMQQFINFCPVISIAGSKMKRYDTNSMLAQLKRVYVERVVRSGFEDRSLYSTQLSRLTKEQLQDFQDLKRIVGTAKAHKTHNIDINRQGLTNEQYQELEQLKKRNKTNAKLPLTDEEKARLEQLKSLRKNRDAAVSILRAVSIRMPLLIYGAENITNEDELTINNFTTLVDDLSWTVFMPRGVTKELFNKFKHYYDPDIFTAAAKRIRALTRAADNLPIEQRIERITNIFNTFHNPDKETVLTPWRVVNMQLTDTIGGWCFYNKDYNTPLQKPRFVQHGNITANIFTHNARILEINSKTGLYPLYMTYSLYRARLNELNYDATTIQQQQEIWDSVVSECIFVLCMSPMAKSITRRTLVGFRNTKVNTRHFINLINQIKYKTNNLLQKLPQGHSFWNANNNDNMKFNAIVGNPPYQVMDGGAGASATPVYNLFTEAAKKLNPQYISLIMPSRWMTGGKGLDEFRKNMMNDTHMQLLYDYADASICFDNVDIKGGICYFLWNKDHNAPCTVTTQSGSNVSSQQRMLNEGDDVFIRNPQLVSINNKVQNSKSESFETIVSSRKPFGLAADFFNDPAKYDLPPLQDTPVEGGYAICGLLNAKRIFKYIPADYPLPKQNGLFGYKVFVPKAWGIGELGEMPPAPFVAGPNQLCTETFLMLGPFATKTEADNTIKYIQTRFFRAQLSIRKVTQNTSQSTYRFVPLQDFTPTSDIDWTQSIDDIDRQLFNKYGLNDDERAFIHRTIKPMT